jgi:hypothetical protein
LSFSWPTRRFTGWHIWYGGYSTDWMTRGSHPFRDKTVSCSLKCPEQLQSSPTLLSPGKGLKWSGREVNRSLRSSVEVKYEWSYTLTPSKCVHGVDREKNCRYLLQESSHPPITKQLLVTRVSRTGHTILPTINTPLLELPVNARN